MCAISSDDAATSMQAIQMVSTARFQDLPIEVALEILGQLSQKDLRAFSKSSSTCYSRALDAGLYIQRTVRWDSFEEAAFRVSLEKLDQIIDYASDVRPRLNIGIHLVCMPTDQAEAAAGDLAARRCMLSVQRALPNLVRLDLGFSYLVSDAVYDALCAHFAPKLRDLNISHRRDAPLHFPPNLFNGAAEKLRKVTLDLRDVQSLSTGQPIAAFQSVTHLKLSLFRASQPLALARIFPSLQALALFCTQSRAAGNIDLSGLQLRSVALSGRTAVLNDASQTLLRTIPVIEQQLTGVTAEPVWPAQSEEIYGVAERWDGGALALSFGSRDAAWRRTLAPGYLEVETLPLAKIPLLASRLVSLTLPESLVNAFVQAPATLTGLRELRIDISLPADGVLAWGALQGIGVAAHIHFELVVYAAHRVQCPALARLAIIAGHATAAKPALVFPEMVVRLGRALGLRGSRPALTFAGCASHTIPDAPGHMEISRLFSSVEFVQSLGGRANESYDTCRYSGYFDKAEWT
ncbi:hypothetical protein AURDEDRAFT_131188 [Auricularia subglabra TFB-10046 SS5]|uniref:F-box domain-containing protein n=1 Tax=Auricularia subglabra (strain TFB-10046 / SS5) TaxID=717982 RepID=J0LD03_AURST|nr:hypothetical protein AURDEDRAFT_131188 [Auricularia subglabra TFB-10046 SS5]